MEILSYYKSGDHVWRIEAKEAEKVIGGAFLIIQKPNAKLGYITSKQEGVGRLILEEVIKCAAMQGCTQITGSFQPVPETHKQAFNLYTNSGFKVDLKKQTIELSLDNVNI